MPPSLTYDDLKCRPIRVLVVDGHAAVRHTMARFITALDDMELSGEAADGEEALRLCARSHPDVVLMAVIMPGMPAVEIIRAIRQQWPPTRVLGMSTFQQEERVSEVLRAGAVGYLLKNVSAEELARTIRRACAAYEAASQSPAVAGWDLYYRVGSQQSARPVRFPRWTAVVTQRKPCYCVSVPLFLLRRVTLPRSRIRTRAGEEERATCK